MPRCRALGIGAGQADAPPGEAGVRGPDLLAADQPAARRRARARVVSEARSDPASGSLKSWHHSSLASRIDGSQRAFCSSVPWASRVGPARLMPTRFTGCGAPGPGVLHVEQGDLDRRGVPPAVGRRPVDADPAVGGQAGLPGPAPGDLLLVVGERRRRLERRAANQARTSAAKACSSAVKARSIGYRSQKRWRPAAVRAGQQRGLVVGGERPVGHLAPVAVPDGVAADPVGAELLHGRGPRLRTLLVPVVGTSPGDPHVAGPPLGPEVGLGVEPARRRSAGSSAAPSRRTTAAITWSPAAHVGHAVDGGHDDVGVSDEGGLDRARPGSSRRRPGSSPPSARRSRGSGPRRGSRGRRSSTSRCGWPSRWPRRCCSSPRTGRLPAVLTISPTHVLGVEQPAVGVEAGRPASRPPSSSTTLHRLARPAERAGRHVGLAVDGDAALGGAEGVDDPTPKRRANVSTTSGAPLVAEGDPQRVVGVVGLLRRGDEVAERLAGVVEPGGAVAADVGQPLRRR